jgi:hypothetical protein
MSRLMAGTKHLHLIINDYQDLECAPAHLESLKHFTDSALSARADLNLTVSVEYLSGVFIEEKETKANTAALLNQAMANSPNGSFVCFLNLGDILNLQSVVELLQDLESAECNVGLGTTETLLVPVSNVLAPSKGRALSKTDNNVLTLKALMSPPPSLSCLFVSADWLRRSRKKFDVDIGWEAAKNSFYLDITTAEKVVFRSGLRVSRTMVLCPDAQLEGKHRELLEKKFNYDVEAINTAVRSYGDREVFVKVSELQELLSKVAEVELYAPFEQLFRKFLVFTSRQWPRAFYLGSNALEASSNKIIKVSKKVIDLANGLMSMPTAFKAAVTLVKAKYSKDVLCRVPVFINNRNRLEMMADLVSFLEQSGFKEITIIDNASDYPPLLRYYENCKHKVIKLAENKGPLAIWQPELSPILGNNFYIYTDSDVVPVFPPGAEFVKRALIGFIRYPYLKKVGLSLRIDNLPDCYQKKAKVIEHESQFWLKPKAGGFFDAPVDTTFAIYAPKAKGGFWLRSFRMAPPWQAEHRPWYVDDKNLSANETHYVKTASTWASWKRR